MDLEAELAATVESLFGDVFGAPVSAIPSTTHEISLSACMHITGTWSGVVVVSASRGFSRVIASTLLETPVDEVTDQDEVDALAEFVNIIAGNVKGMFDGQSTLTVPIVARGSEVLLPSTTRTTRCVFVDSDESYLTVSLFGNVATDALPDVA